MFDLIVKVEGLGRIYVEFETVGEAETAERALSGRSFANRTVVTSFLEEEKYHRRSFE